MEKLFKEVIADDQTKTYEEVPVFRTFENEEAFNEVLAKSTQSASSKAKGDILAELGIKSVQEGLDRFNKAGDLSEVEKQLLSVKEQYAELETKHNAIIAENQNNMEQLVLSKYTVPEGFKDDFKTLVKAGVKEKTDTDEGVTFEQSAKSVFERLNITQVKNKIQIGGDPKAPLPEELKAQMLNLRKL